MSNIDSLFGNASGTNQINPSLLANQGIIGAANQGKDANSFDTAIAQALAQIGVVPPVVPNSDPSVTGSSTTSATSAASATQTAQQALQTFLNDLFANIHSQSTTTASTSGAGGASGAHHAHHHHGGGGGLDSLIQEIDASDTTDSGSLISDSLTGSTVVGSSSTSGISSLQQDFQNLLSSVGASGNQVSLSDFLKSVSNNLHTTNASNNVAASV